MTPRPLRFHSTLTGREENFEPGTPGRVSLYVCGVTPYDECHLGHARCYVTFDFIRRCLERLGYAVTHVQNFTDVDDKIIRRAAERGEAPEVLADRYIADYFDKMDRLGVQRAAIYPRVTAHVPAIVSFIE
ncbi:MAG TPA: cysteine--tRNA ligase, partial [Elusimicrobiota bacterium]|nr:cysteine--tRNA ligase [Elusimicrobiota bacterium]